MGFMKPPAKKWLLMIQLLKKNCVIRNIGAVSFGAAYADNIMEEMRAVTSLAGVCGQWPGPSRLTSGICHEIWTLF